MRYVLDSSAILASLKNEPGAALVDSLIGESFVSTVNLAELATVLTRDGSAAPAVRAIIAGLPAMAIAPDAATAIDAGLLHALTGEAGLSLGDRFCLALGRRLEAPVLTADRKWEPFAAKLDLSIRLIR